MFGEEIMLGQATVSKDEKNRIILPKFTNAEEGDKLLVVDEIDFLSIYSEDVYLDQIKKIEEQLNNVKTHDELKKINLQILKYYRTILKKVVCDKQHRINLGLVNNNTNKILCIGAKDHLIIETKK